MSLRIIQNPDKEKYNAISKAVVDNDGFCPCSIIRSDDTLCLCKEFREQETEGECHCSRFIKVLI